MLTINHLNIFKYLQVLLLSPLLLVFRKEDKAESVHEAYHDAFCKEYGVILSLDEVVAEIKSPYIHHYFANHTITCDKCGLVCKQTNYFTAYDKFNIFARYTKQQVINSFKVGQPAPSSGKFKKRNNPNSDIEMTDEEYKASKVKWWGL